MISDMYPEDAIFVQDQLKAVGTDFLSRSSIRRAPRNTIWHGTSGWPSAAGKGFLGYLGWVKKNVGKS